MSKVPVNSETNPLVMLDTNMGGLFYMRLADAVAAVQLLARAQRAEYSWTDKCYKFTKPESHGGGGGITVRTLTVSQVAQLHLEDEA